MLQRKGDRSREGRQTKFKNALLPSMSKKENERVESRTTSLISVRASADYNPLLPTQEYCNPGKVAHTIMLL